MPVDHELNHYCEGIRQLVEIPIYENKYTNYLIRRFTSIGLDQPDSKYSFQLQHSRAIKKLKGVPDLIYSRSFPMSSTFMAYRLWKHYKVPWVMHWSDPWSWSPLHEYSGKSKAFIEYWEKEFISSADAVALTSEKTIEYYQKLYPQFESKFFLSPNVYERRAKSVWVKKTTTKLKVVYTGGLVGDRNPSFLFEFLNVWNKQNKALATQIEFHFAGAMDTQSTRMFESNKLENVFHHGLLSFEQAKKLQLEADVLLLIDNPIANSDQAVFFPSKLLDYFEAQKKIMAITTKDSTTDRTLSTLEEPTIGHGNFEQLEHFITVALNKFKEGDQSYFNKKVAPEEYEVGYNCELLFQKFKSLTNK